ncbi:hypothetical protein SDC9_104300 [bioreactor metagenome]|uniref:Uncharacterized protein n=1 Tax=bioreactor metagenome TaxID=1076179 RepID=A0A645AXI4_9ZZZZ
MLNFEVGGQQYNPFRHVIEGSGQQVDHSGIGTVFLEQAIHQQVMFLNGQNLPGQDREQLQRQFAGEVFLPPADDQADGGTFLA